MEKKKLLDVCHIQYGFPFDSSHFTSCETDMPLIRIRDVKEGKTSTYYNADYTEEYIVRKGEYLIGMDGEFNIAPWNSQNALLNQRVCKVTSKTPEVSIDYVYRFLTKELKKIEDETPFVTVKHLSAKRLNQVFLPLPPLTTQQQIVSELDLLSHILDQKRQQLMEYDTLAASIFFKMFGDEADFNYDKLAKVTSKIGSGATPKGGNQAYKEVGISLIRSLNVHNTEFKYEDLAHIDEEQAAALNNVVIEKNDVLFNITGASVTRSCIVPDNVLPARVNQHVAIIRPNTEVLNYVFLNYLLVSTRYHDKLYTLSRSNGATREAITKAQLENFIIPIPPINLQLEFAAKIESIEQQKQLLKESIKETETLFQSRMDYWFNS